MVINDVHFSCWCRRTSAKGLQIPLSLRSGRDIMVAGVMFLERRMVNFSEKASLLFIYER